MPRKHGMIQYPPGKGQRLEERRPIAIQQAIRDPRRSAVGKYQDLVVGSRSVLRLLLHELVITTTSWVPGALGLVLRRIGYPWLLGAVGRNVTFGSGVVLRHPAKYWDAVLKTRAYLAEHHSFQRRFTELFEILDGARS